ncbi:MAG: putative bifunctional diguanylate cyclase/phosphodiesterase [Alishewanella aestuarii]
MRFLSFPSKILALTLVLMLVLLIVITSISVQRLNDSFATQQQLKQQQVEQHFSQYQQLLHSQLQAWFDSFAELMQLPAQQGFSQFTEALQQRYDSFSLYLNIEALWFFAPEQTEPLFATSALPAELTEMVIQTRQQQRPVTRNYCAEHCSTLVSLPLSDGDGQVGVLIASQTLADIVVAMGQALRSEVVIVATGGQQTRILSATSAAPTAALTNLDVTTGLFQAGPDSYYLYALPLTEQQGQHYALLLLEDLSAYQRANQQFRWQLIGMASLCFLLFAWLTYWLTRRLTGRLLKVSRVLPLLAEHQFKAFRAALPVKSPLLVDEVDRLSEVSQTLSFQLEQLQHDVLTQTRELENMAMFDLLTGLANRNMLQFQLKKRLAALTPAGHFLGLFFLDLDQFKRVNDIRGHEQGDQLLIEAAQRLRTVLQKTDLACRFGGDEFVVVTEAADLQQLEQLAARLVAVFRQPMHLQGEEYQLNVSVGISCSRDASLKPDDLVRQADLAMYQAKARGGCCWHFYSQQMFDAFQDRLALEQDLKLALSLQQFDLHLQPKIRLTDRKLVGLEALLRWQSPSRGLVPPDEFISVLEYAQLMIPVGYWVIEQGFSLMAGLRQAGLGDLQLAINLSPAQLTDPGLPVVLEQLLQKYQLNAADFEFELTESMLAKNLTETINSMQRLKAQGFALAIDDFGTGYSSLSYLRQLPVDTIKIDKSFVFGMLDNQADYDIITSTIAMVRKLGLQVVAEGVETQAQAKSLLQHQCDQGQGYLFARPIPAANLVQTLTENINQLQQWR